MKRLIIIGALILATVAVGVTFVLVKNRPPKEYEGDDLYTKTKVLQFDRSTINKIELASENGTLVLERNEDGEMQVDYRYPIILDEMDVEDIKATFGALWAEDIVAEDPEDLSIYGLDNPRVVGTGLKHRSA